MEHQDDQNQDAVSPMIELTTFAPFYIGVIANTMTRTSSKKYLEEFGIGVVEWRAMVVFAIYQQSTAQNISEIVGMDKAAASRSCQKLEILGIIEQAEGTFKGRSKPFVLTAKGRALYRKIEPVSLQTEQALLSPLNKTERQQLLGLLQRIHANLPNFSEH